jgi:hypothetical protein
VAAYWFDFYTPADARAGDNAARYRSSYVWLCVLATAAVMFGALSGIFHGRDEVMDWHPEPIGSQRGIQSLF